MRWHGGAGGGAYDSNDHEDTDRTACSNSHTVADDTVPQSTNDGKPRFFATNRETNAAAYVWRAPRSNPPAFTNDHVR